MILCVLQKLYVQHEDGQCQAPKRVVVPYVVNARYTSYLLTYLLHGAESFLRS